MPKKGKKESKTTPDTEQLRDEVQGTERRVDEVAVPEAMATGLSSRETQLEAACAKAAPSVPMLVLLSASEPERLASGLTLANVIPTNVTNRVVRGRAETKEPKASGSASDGSSQNNYDYSELCYCLLELIEDHEVIRKDDEFRGILDNHHPISIPEMTTLAQKLKDDNSVDKLAQSLGISRDELDWHKESCKDNSHELLRCVMDRWISSESRMDQGGKKFSDLAKALDKLGELEALKYLCNIAPQIVSKEESAQRTAYTRGQAILLSYFVRKTFCFLRLGRILGFELLFLNDLQELEKREHGIAEVYSNDKVLVLIGIWSAGYGNATYPRTLTGLMHALRGCEVSEDSLKELCDRMQAVKAAK